MSNILIISGHTDLEHSVVNKEILNILHSKLPNAEIVKLDSLYPNFQIDEKKEQERVKKADIILFVFPLFWYAAPAPISRWLEKTFTHGFAYTSKGGLLKGKTLIVSVSSGCPKDYFSKTGLFGYTIDDLMGGFKCTCTFSAMNFGGVVLLDDVSYLSRINPEMIKKQKERCVHHVDELLKKIKEASK